jgi:two-component system sensor histidine kinase ChiS
MKTSIAQPSLSRDFALLSGVILFILVLLSLWVAWSSYEDESKRILHELNLEADRIDRTLEREITSTSYLLNAIGHQLMITDPADHRKIAKILQNYHANSRVFAVWSWADANQNIVVSSNKGVLEKPINISDRDYVHKAALDPWQFQIGSPIEGRVSNRWVIPVSIGVTDDTGKYLGSLTASLDIQSITDEISHLIKRDGVSFAIVSKSLAKLTEVSDKPNFVDTYFSKEMLDRISINSGKESSGIVSKAKLLSASGIYAYYQVSEHYPYILLVGYDAQYSRLALTEHLMPRLLQIISIATFLLLFLWITRIRVIKPVGTLTEAIAGLTRGETYEHQRRNAPVEIDALGVQISRVSQYIEERKRVESELRDKLQAALNDSQIEER